MGLLEQLRYRPVPCIAEIGRNKTRRVEIYIVAAADTSRGVLLSILRWSVPKQSDERVSGGGAGGSTGQTEPYLFQD
jgi:hypothetical protein